MDLGSLGSISVIPSLSCLLESSGEIFIPILPEVHPQIIERETGVGPRFLWVCFFNFQDLFI